VFDVTALYIVAKKTKTTNNSFFDALLLHML